MLFMMSPSEKETKHGSFCRQDGVPSSHAPCDRVEFDSESSGRDRVKQANERQGCDRVVSEVLF